MILKQDTNRLSVFTNLFTLSVIFIAPLCAKADNLLDNPGFETGNTSGWSPFGSSIAASTATAHTGSYSALVTDRTATWNGIAQSLLGRISDNQTCSVTGWSKIQNTSSADVKITIQQTDDAGTNYHPIATSTVYDSGWTNLSGFFTLEVTGTLTALTLYFELPPAGVNFYVDDVSVTITSSGDWETEANERIEQIRKGDFRIIAKSPYGNKPPVENVDVEVQQTKHHFAFGSAISSPQMANTDYLNFFKDHFEWAVMENASKWYANEPTEDNVTYADADNIYTFCSANNITMRGHCIFWAAEGVVQDWVKALSTPQLQLAVEDRLDSAVNHFKGKFVHWDVNNEMCDNSYFADRLGSSIRPWMFQGANVIDPNCLLFLNDYNVISGGYNLSDYKQMAYDLATQAAPIHGLGVQCHMGTGFNPSTIKARFDSVAELNLPIWVTEFDVSDPNEYLRADKIEDFYRVAFSHPSVEGILMWGFWENQQWREDCHIVNADWALNAAGIRYEALMNEWTTNDSAMTGIDGAADFQGFFGTYNVTLTPQGADPTVVTIELSPDEPNEFNIELTDIDEPGNCQQVHDMGLGLAGDLNKDCRVDNNDLVIMAEQWLKCNDPQDLNCIHNW